MENKDLTVRQLFRQKVREICDTLDFFDDLKEKIINSNISINYVLEIDNQIRKIEKELAEISKNMADVDVCNCDGITGGCSSPLCPSRYNLNCSNPFYHTNETTYKKEQKKQ